MAIINLPNGIGESTGDSLVTTDHLESNGTIWWVNSSGGVDAAAPRGKNRLEPLATLAQAHTNSASGDTLVLMDGHTETIASGITITKNLTIVGAGSSSGRPTVKLTNNQAAAAMLTLSPAEFLSIRNIWFEEDAQSNSAARIIQNGGTVEMRGCYIECNSTTASTSGVMTVTGGSGTILKSTTVISTGTGVASQPTYGITVPFAANFMLMDGMVFDNGSYGFANLYAYYATAAANVIRADSISLLRGATIRLMEASVGYIQVGTRTGGAFIEWCDVTVGA